MIGFQCTKCGTLLESPVSMAGQTDTCPVCGTSCEVPVASARRPLIFACAISAVVAACIATAVVLLVFRPPAAPTLPAPAAPTESIARQTPPTGDPGPALPQTAVRPVLAAPRASIPVLQDYLGQWINQSGTLRVALTIRENSTATVDYQDNGENAQGFVYTNPCSYDLRTGVVRLKDGQATLREDGTLRLICRDSPLNLDHILARAKPAEPPAIAQRLPQSLEPVRPTEPPVAVPLRPAEPPVIAQQPSQTPATKPAEPPAPPAVALVSNNTIRVSPPEGGWPESEWASIRISLLKSEYVGKDEHLMLVWGDKFNALSMTVGMTRAMSRKMGMASRNEFGNLDVTTSKTPRNEDGVIVCGFQNRKQPQNQLLRVGTVLAYFYLDDWKDDQGNVVLRLPAAYWDGKGVAKLFVCDRKEKVLATHVLEIGDAPGASTESPPAAPPASGTQRTVK